jgi:hypothetical protein
MHTNHAFAVEEFYSTRYQSGSFSLIIVGSDFSPPAYYCFAHQPRISLCLPIASAVQLLQHESNARDSWGAPLTYS